MRKKVKISALPLNWIFNGDDKITNADLFSIFRNNMEILNNSLLLEVIFQSFWAEQQMLILRYCFFPYVAFFIAANIYYLDFMMMDLLDENKVGSRVFDCGVFWRGSTTCETFYSIELVFRYFFFVLCLHQLALKVYQTKFSGLRILKSSLVETINIVVNITIVLIVIATASNPNLPVTMYTLRVFASVGCVTNWVQMFYWLRLFDRTARYVDLIIETVFDIWVFSAILVLLLLMFGSGVYMVQLNRMEYSVDSA